MENFISKLPNHVLELVVNDLNLPDLYRFGLVCKPWKSICNPVQFHKLIVPILHTNNNNNNSSKQQNNMVFEDIKDMGFFSLRDKKIYTVELPELLNRKICGSFPGGWLMTVHGNSEIQLFNPFSCTKQVIHLPPLTEFLSVLSTEVKENDLYYYIVTRFDSDELFCLPSKIVRNRFIKKVAISSSTITKGPIIMAIQGSYSSLAYYRIGGEAGHVWTPVAPDDKRQHMMVDLTYYKGKFYGVHNNGYVLVVHGLDEKEPAEKIFVEQVIDKPTGKWYNRFYIMEAAGDLLVVIRFPERDIQQSLHYTIGFRVLKLEFGSTNNRWVEVESLGNYSLFLGYNMSFSVSSTKSSGCKANCIYFTDDFYWHFSENYGGHDMGIFHLEDGSIEKFLYTTDRLVMPPPIWLAPNP